MSTKKTFLLRLSPELLSAIQETATEELRSVHAQMETFLREGLQRMGRAVAVEKREENEASPAAPRRRRPAP